jgi:hypothetical protein
MSGHSNCDVDAAWPAPAPEVLLASVVGPEPEVPEACVLEPSLTLAELGLVDTEARLLTLVIMSNIQFRYRS